MTNLPTSAKRLKDEIMKLSDKELLIKAAELNGEKIVCEEWPCGDYPGDCGFYAAEIVIKKGDGWTTDTPQCFDTPWPVVVADPEWKGSWPPVYDESEGDWQAIVKPIKDYPNDLVAAMELWEKIHEVKEIWWGNEGSMVVNICRDPNGSCAVEGKPEELPRLLTQTFVIYKEMAK